MIFFWGLAWWGKGEGSYVIWFIVWKDEGIVIYRTFGFRWFLGRCRFFFGVFWFLKFFLFCEFSISRVWDYSGRRVFFE